MAGILINHNIMTVKQWNTFLTQYIIFKHVEPPFPRKTTTHCKPIPASEPFSKPSLNHPPNFKLSFRCFLRRFQFRNSRLSLLPPLLQLSHQSGRRGILEQAKNCWRKHFSAVLIFYLSFYSSRNSIGSRVGSGSLEKLAEMARKNSS